MHTKIKSECLLLIIVMVGVRPSSAQVSTSEQVDSFIQLIATLKAHHGCSRQVTSQQMNIITQDSERIAAWIASRKAETVSATLPEIISNLSAGDEEDQICATHVLLDVALRSDSAMLLRGHLNAIGAVLNNSPDERLQRSTGTILTMLRPGPPPEVVPSLLEFLKRADRDPHIQAAAVGPLALAGPQNNTVIDGIGEFWARPLDAQSKESVLNGLANARAKEPRLVAIVISALQDPDRDVSLTAIRAIGRMGSEVIRQAIPELRKLASSGQTDESTDPKMLQIGQTARQVLATIENP